MQMTKAQIHLPGLYEFYEFYKVFLPIYDKHREFFYEWCEIASIYGAPADCIWSGGRIGLGENNTKEVLDLLGKYGISARLTFSNSLIEDRHLEDKKCNKICALFENYNGVPNGVIIHSDLLMNHIKNEYPKLYFVSSTTKVLTKFEELHQEIKRDDFTYVVPDFRLNKCFDRLEALTANEKAKVEFLCNECCSINCMDRRKCYENVSMKSLDEECPEHICRAKDSDEGYVFSKAMQNPAFISNVDIVEKYLPAGFNNFKIEGRGLGSALLLEFILYYMVKPECQLRVRELIYLDNMLNLF